MVLTLYRRKAGSAALVAQPRIAAISGKYYGSRSLFPGAASTVVLAADTLYAVAFYAPSGFTTSNIGVNVSATGTATALRLGLYGATAAGLPGALIGDSGALDPSGTGDKEAAMVKAIAQGVLYYLVILANGSATVVGATHTLALYGSGTLNDAAGRGTLTRAFAYAALPDPFGTPAASIPSTNAPYVALKVA